MPSILEIQIGIHYSVTQKDFPDIKTFSVKRAIENLLRNGLIEEAHITKTMGKYRKSDALHRWIKALEAVPFPVIE